MKKISNVSIQGQIASFSHIAVENILKIKYENLFQRDSFKEVFDDLKLEKAELAVIPIENSTYGSIFVNYDNMTNYKTRIMGEIYLQVKFCLIGTPDSSLENIKEVYSHPVATGQVQKYLNKNKQIKVIEYPDTAGSVKYIADLGENTKASIASEYACNYYGMKILKKDIHENKKNYTRFYVITLEENYDKFKDIPDLTFYKNNQKYKTTIEFTLGEEVGSLYKVLQIFAKKDITLSKIESRPIINTHWNYRFYLDLVHNFSIDYIKEIFESVKSITKNFEYLGSYSLGDYVAS